MHYYTLNQTYVFLFSVYGGLLMGLVYDGLRALRHLLRAKTLLTGVLDALFWLFAAVLGGYVLLLSSDGRIRVYPFLGYVLGFAVYRTGISRLFLSAVGFFRKKRKK